MDLVRPSRLEKHLDVAVLASGSGGFQVDSANISDSPRYTFRGLMIDPARRFLPVVTLQAMMDAMSCERRTSLCFVRNQPCTCMIPLRLIHTRCWITTRGPHLSCFFAAPTVYPCFERSDARCCWITAMHVSLRRLRTPDGNSCCAQMRSSTCCTST